MSTRATIHFCYPGEKKATAIVYRHNDGYPDGLGKDLTNFVKQVKQDTDDTRFDDAAYLAAKWIVYDALEHVDISKKYLGSRGNLGFLGVGIVDRDPGDIEYRYTVVCDGQPTITCKPIK